MYDLKNDQELSSLIYPISQTAYNKLEADIFDNGCCTPILVWRDIIIDGRKRYEICKKWGLPFQIKELTFSHRSDAIIWICKNQLMRSDLSGAMHKYLVGKYYESKKARYRSGLFHDSAYARGYSSKLALEIGQEVFLVSGTVYKYGVYTRAIDAIAGKDRLLADRILGGKLRISQSNIIELSRLSKNEIQAVSKIVLENNIEHFTYTNIRHELYWKKSSSKYVDTKPDASPATTVKDTPLYDPDAEISSLALTIPSWISSIERARTMADLSNTTAQGREKLFQALTSLREEVFNMYRSLQEVDCNGK